MLQRVSLYFAKPEAWSRRPIHRQTLLPLLSMMPNLGADSTWQYDPRATFRVRLAGKAKNEQFEKSGGE